MFMKRPKISVVIPVYNAQLYIGQCIESILNQTVKELEIIIIDDGSTDESNEICRKYAQKDERIIFFEQENRGAAATRNRGLELATGEWFIGIDADDWCDENYFESMLKEAEKDPHIDVVIANCKRILEIDGKVSIENRTEFDREFLTDKKEDIIKLQANTLAARVNECGVKSDIIALRSIATPWDKIYKMDIIKKNNLRYPIRAESREDILFSLNYFHYVKKACYIHNYGYNYRVLDNSLSHGYSPNILKRDDCALEEMYLYLKSIHEDDLVWKKAIRQGIYVATIRFFIEEIQRYFFSEQNILKKDICIELFKDRCRNQYYRDAFLNVNMLNLSEVEKGYIEAFKKEDFEQFL